MKFIIDSVLSAFLLLWSWDPGLYFIIYVSLKVSLTSTLIAGMLGVPAGFLIALNEFGGKRFVIMTLNSLLAMPTVVVGLLVYAFITRKGLLGMLDLLYTQKAMVIGQVILIFPIMTSLTIAAVKPG
jgi:tungstate transport system permease protein